VTKGHHDGEAADGWYASRVGVFIDTANIEEFDVRSARIAVGLALLRLIQTAAHAEEQSQGPWDMSHVIWYRENPEATTARLQWCVDHQSGDNDCGAAMQACGDILRVDPRATCHVPVADATDLGVHWGVKLTVGPTQPRAAKEALARSAAVVRWRRGVVAIVLV
jgi:hypothetical protein